MEKRENTTKKILIISLVLYMLLIIWVVIFKCGFNTSIVKSLDPLIYSNGQTAKYNHNFTERLSFWMTNKYISYGIFENIIIFAPFSFILTLCIKKHNFIYPILFSTLFSFSLEAFQLFTNFGVFDVVDILTNILGGIIGSIIAFIPLRVVSVKKRELVINALSITILLVCIALTIYSIYTYIVYAPYISTKWDYCIKRAF